MDPSSSSTANENTKKRSVSPEEEAQEVQGCSKRSCPNSSSLPSAGTKAGDLIRELYGSFMAGKVQELKLEMERRIPHSINNSLSGEDETRAREIVDGLIEENRAKWESEFRQLLINEFDGIAKLQLKPLPPTPRKYKLRFCDKIMVTMYHGDEIKSSTDNKVLKIEICDAYSNTVISNEPISSAMVELFLKEKGSGTPISREKTRELISFNHLQFRLQHGIGYVEGLAVKSSKYWKSNHFVLGVKVIDELILEKIGTIEEASSESFKVLTKRSKGNKKHFPPIKQSEIWRVTGVRKDGVYHRIFSSEELDIKTVGDFLRRYHEMSSPTLEEFLKRSMSKLDEWDDIVEHAKTCVGYDPNDYDQTDNNNTLMGAGLQVNYSNQNVEVNNHQNQIVEDNNNNLVGTDEQLANTNENLGVLNDENQSVVQDTDQNLVVDNYENESFDQEANYSKEDSEVGENELPRAVSPDQQWFVDRINLDLDSPSDNWATQMILESPNPYGIDYRVEQPQELGP